MFCRKCGKENYPGQAFCVNCGSALENQSEGSYKKSLDYGYSEETKVASGVADILKNGIDRRKLNKLTVLLVIIIIGIIFFFPGRIFIGLYNADVENEFQISTDNCSIYETDSCVYYAGDDYLYRVYKDNGGNEKITNKCVEIIGGASDVIYFKDPTGTVYSVSDDKSDPKEIKNIDETPYSGSFISGRYTYIVTGMNVMKCLNSRLASSNVSIYETDDDGYIEKAIKCGDYMYMMVSSENHGTNNLIRLDLNSSKTKKLIESIDDFSMTDKNIACSVYGNSAVVMDLDGENQSFFKSDKYSSQIEKILCMGDTVYCYDYWGDWYAFDVETLKSRDLHIDEYKKTMEAGLSVLAYKYDNTLYVCNSLGVMIESVEL